MDVAIYCRRNFGYNARQQFNSRGCQVVETRMSLRTWCSDPIVTVVGILCNYAGWVAFFGRKPRANVGPLGLIGRGLIMDSEEEILRVAATHPMIDLLKIRLRSCSNLKGGEWKHRAT